MHETTHLCKLNVIKINRNLGDVFAFVTVLNRTAPKLIESFEELCDSFVTVLNETVPKPRD